MTCKTVRAFRRDDAGTISVLFAISVFLILGVVGAGLDYARGYLAKTRLQASLDAALLAGAQAKIAGAADVDNAIMRAFQANWGESEKSPEFTYTIEGDTISGQARVPVPAMLTAAIGFTEITAGAQSAVSWGLGNAEVVLALDTTGSMTGAKLDGAKAAAKDLVDSLFATTGGTSRVKVGLVPFSRYVNVGMTYRNATWMSVPADRTETKESCGWYSDVISQTNCRMVTGTCSNDGVNFPCTYETCDYTYGPSTYRCTTDTDEYTWKGCVGSRAYPADIDSDVTSANPVPGILNASGCPSSLQRLTEDKQVLKDQIDAMVADGETFVQPGLLWGWRVLSEGAPFADGSGRGKRVLVLMTDGANTRSPTYPDHKSSDPSLANTLMAETCTRIKAQGIEIYAVAFDVTDATINTLLNQCASGPPYYFSATSVSELSSAFSKIADSLKSVRVSY
jgi:Flp pilus assembly protein TadG